MEETIKKLTDWAAQTGIKIVVAVLLLIIAFRVVNVIARKLDKHLTKKLDKTITRTLINVGKVLAKIVICICLVGYLGIDTSGLTALVASLGVCAGLAVNGALANLAGGILIIVTRPFKIGDYISAQGHEGTVEDITITATKVITVDNKAVFIPNGSLSSGTIVNYSEKQNRRVDLTFSVAGNNPDTVKALIKDVCAADSRVLTDPAVFVKVTDYGAGNGTKVQLRAWCKTENYWDVYFDLLNGIRTAFEEKGIVIPFNQLDVHIKNN